MHENCDFGHWRIQLKEESKGTVYLYVFINKRSPTAHQEFLAYRRAVSQLARLVPETFKSFLCVDFHPLISSQSPELKNETGGTKRTGRRLTLLGGFSEGVGLANMPTVVCQQLLGSTAGPLGNDEFMCSRDKHKPSPQSHLENTTRLF